MFFPNRRVSFFDATNSTMSRRQWIIDTVRERIPGAKWIFLESIVSSEELVSML